MKPRIITDKRKMSPRAKEELFGDLPVCITHKTKGSLRLYVAGFRPAKIPASQRKIG